MTTPDKTAKLQFLTWVKQNHPNLFYAALDTAEMPANNLGCATGLGEVETKSLWDKLSTGLLSLGTTYLSLKNQRDAMKLNLARAQQGLPPVDAGVTAPVIRTEIDLPPDVISKITSETGTNINKILIFGLIALGAIMVMKKK